MMQLAVGCRRRDAVRAAYVEAGRKIAVVLGKERAQAWLQREGFGAAVIERVLSGNPDEVRRRD